MNEQERNDNEEKNEALGDLELTADDADQTRAGTGTHATGGGGGAGKAQLQDIHFVAKL